MNILNNFVKGSAVTLATLVALATTAPVVSAIPYTGDDTQPSPVPAFNVFTGNVPQQGDERDFFRGKAVSDPADSVTDVRSTCETGKRFALRVYVHNGASQYKNDNGNGPSVAKDSKVKINLDNASAKSGFNPKATISASNAASVTDGMTITCSDGKTVKLSYVAGTAEQYNTASGVKKLSDSIVTTGAPIGTNAPDGNMWGCWDQRVLVRLIVEVKEEVKPIIGTGVCKVTDLAILNKSKREVEANVTGVTTGQGVSIVGYQINWGDGSESSAKQKDTHTYAKDGTYTITGKVQLKFADGSTKWVEGPDCVRTVTFKPGQPPVVPPTTVVPPSGTLPDTGVNPFGLFATVSMVGAFLHRAYKSRKLSV